MSAKTISHCQGKGSLTHNNRTFKPKNVDSSRSSQNVTFVKIPIAVAYDKCFAEAVERYNAKQKRPDRRIKNGYFRYVFSHAPSNNVITSPDNRKSFYEDVVQIGDKNDTGIGTADAETAAKCLIEYMQGFSERNPNFFVFNAVLHMDEATPHLHIDYIPIGHYKRSDKLLDDSLAYHELLSKHKELEERCQRADSELGKFKDKVISAVMHITDIAKLSNCMLAPITGYEDLAEKATPLHKTLSNVIRRLCSRFVRSLGFDKEADIISKKAGISEEALSEFKSFENPAQSKKFRR